MSTSSRPTTWAATSTSPRSSRPSTARSSTERAADRAQHLAGARPVQEAEFFQKHSQTWRISDDFWDERRLLRQQFEYARDWAPEIGKGNTWPDADMLAIGRLRLASNGGEGEPGEFTPDEQRTMMTLWSIMRSPLIMGGDLPRCDAFTLSLLTNPEVIAVDQHSRNNRPVLTRGDFTAWAAEAADGRNRYVAVFNLGESAATLEVPWTDLGIPAERWSVRDLWRREDLGADRGLRRRPGTPRERSAQAVRALMGRHRVAPSKERSPLRGALTVETTASPSVGVNASSNRPFDTITATVFLTTVR